MGVRSDTAEGVYVPPFAALHKFPEASQESEVVYDIRVVDADGDELLYDARAAPPLNGGSMLSGTGDRLVNELGEQERQQLLQHLFTRAVEHRESVESGEQSLVDQGSFPRHGLDYHWTADKLDDFDRFAGLRIYANEITYSRDGSHIEAENESLVFEWEAR